MVCVHAFMVCVLKLDYRDLFEKKNVQRHCDIERLNLWKIYFFNDIQINENNEAQYACKILLSKHISCVLKL